MSDQVRPTDVYAVARLDWCRPSGASEGGGGQAAQLVCSNLARQCGSFTNATRDRERVARTAPQLQLLLREPELESWDGGKCPKIEASGVCGLGGVRDFQEQLWSQLAAPRERAAYEAARGGAAPAAEPASASAAAPTVLFSQHVPTASRPAVVPTSSLLGAPFL
jgi:hypothetical protein